MYALYKGVKHQDHKPDFSDCFIQVKSLHPLLCGDGAFRINGRMLFDFIRVVYIDAHAFLAKIIFLPN